MNTWRGCARRFDASSQLERDRLRDQPARLRTVVRGVDEGVMMAAIECIGDEGRAGVPPAALEVLPEVAQVLRVETGDDRLTLEWIRPGRRYGVERVTKAVR